MKPVRMLNLGPTNWLRTQSVYRSTARLLPEREEDTIVMSTPVHPYVAVGGGLALQDAVDVDACVRLDVPVVSSPLSQPVTYLDSMALVSQWVFAGQETAPLVDALLAGVLAAFRSLGVTHAGRAGDNIQVGDRILFQTQTGRIDEAVIVQGEMFFSVDHDRITQLTGESNRAALWSETSRPVSPDMAHTLLMDAFARELGRPIERGKPAQVETRISKQLDLEMLEEAAGLLGKEVKRVARH